MSAAEPFFDTNVLLYLLSADAARADRAEALLAGKGTISVQVLNEFAAVTTHKLRMPLKEVRAILGTIRRVCSVQPLTVETHDRALDLVRRYGYSIYDSLVVASALLAGCDQLYSEDFQHGQLIDRRLRIVNPFIA